MWTATDGGGLGEEETESVSTVLYWEPTDRLSIKLRHMFLHDEDGPPATGILKGEDFDTCTGRTFPGRFDEAGNPYTIDFTNGQVVVEGPNGKPLPNDVKVTLKGDGQTVEITSKRKKPEGAVVNVSV